MTESHPAQSRRPRALRATTVATLATAMLATAAGALPATAATSTWDGIRKEVWQDRPMLPGVGIVNLKAPTRPEDQRAVPVHVDARLSDGRTIKTVSFIVDENPSPVAAVFHIEQPREHVTLAAKFRFNAQTDLHIVVEASDGALYMVQQNVKFAGGQAACAAPPNGDPKEIAASMGRMQLAEIPEKKTAATHIERRVKLDVSHPNHTGMVLDQQTLLYIPLLMVQHVAVREGKDTVFSMDGSITLAQNPEIEFDYKINGADKLTVDVEDTGGGKWQQSFPISPAS